MWNLDNIQAIMHPIDYIIIFLFAFCIAYKFISIARKLWRKCVAKIAINGVEFQCDNLDIVGGKVIVNGKDVTNEITITNNVLSLKVTEGVLGNVTCKGSVSCLDVSGDVNAGGSVSCGNVGGSVDAGGSVSCKSVSGSIDAGGSVVVNK